MNTDKIKKSNKTDTIQIRIDGDLKKEFIAVCDKQDYNYSAVLREMIKDFVSGKYININKSAHFQLQELACLYGLNLDSTALKIINDKHNSDIHNSGSK